MMEPIIDKKLVKELEKSTTRIENLFGRSAQQISPPYNVSKKLKCLNVFSDIMNWYDKYGLVAGMAVPHWKKLTELFKFKPIYYPMYWYKNALWAFNWRKQPVLIYYSQRGLSIQVSKKFRKDWVEDFLFFLKKKLGVVKEKDCCNCGTQDYIYSMVSW